MLESQTAIDDPEDGKAPYRLGVLLVLVNDKGEIFIGKRVAVPSDGKPWQLPQGGIKQFFIEGRMAGRESAEQAALRELREEIGADLRVGVLAIGSRSLTFEFDCPGNGKYRGQSLTPVLMHYQGGAIDISRIEEGDTSPAFSDYGWFVPQEILTRATAVKVPIYRQALEEFMPLIKKLDAQDAAAATEIREFRLDHDTNIVTGVEQT